jgi:hypothetical protein
MSVRIVSALARPDLADQADEATAGASPSTTPTATSPPPAGLGCTTTTPISSWCCGTTPPGRSSGRPTPSPAASTGPSRGYRAAFPETGRYVFPEGLALLHVDRKRDVGLYHEPNVWVAHHAQPAGGRG